MYHGVGEVPEDPNHLFVSPRRFAEQMAWLERCGLRGVGVGSLTDAMREDGGRGLVGITFDDGYASVLESALPELKRREFGATVFILSIASAAPTIGTWGRRGRCSAPTR